MFSDMPLCIDLIHKTNSDRIQGSADMVSDMHAVVAVFGLDGTMCEVGGAWYWHPIFPN